MNKNRFKIKAKEVAEYLGVSPATVSLALNDKPGVNPDTKRRIQEYVSKLEKGTGDAIDSGTIIMATYGGLQGSERPDNRTLFNISYVEISKILQRAHMDIKLKYVYTSQELLELFDYAVDNALGIILNADEMPDTELDLLDSCAVPLVVYAADLIGENWDVVNFHNAKAVTAGMQLLEQNGHRDIIYLKNNYTINNFTSRRKAFVEYVNQSSYIQGDGRGRVISTGLDTESVCEAIIQYLAGRKELPDAIFSENYMVSIGLSKAVQVLGLKIPEDISIIGIDEIPESAPMSYQMYYFKIPHKDRSVMVANLLLERIKTKNKRSAIEIFLSIKMIEGNSILLK